MHHFSLNRFDAEHLLEWLIYEPDGVLISLPAEVLVTDQASADTFKQRVVLYRQGQVRTNSGKGISSAHCPGCGAGKRRHRRCKVFARDGC